MIGHTTFAKPNTLNEALTKNATLQPAAVVRSKINSKKKNAPASVFNFAIKYVTGRNTMAGNTLIGTMSHNNLAKK